MCTAGGVTAIGILKDVVVIIGVNKLSDIATAKRSISIKLNMIARCCKTV